MAVQHAIRAGQQRIRSMSWPVFGFWMLLLGFAACLGIYRIATSDNAAKVASSSVIVLVLVSLSAYCSWVRFARVRPTEATPPASRATPLPATASTFRYRATAQLPTALVFAVAIAALVSQRVGYALAIWLAFLTIYLLFWRPWALEVDGDGIKVGFIFRRALRLTVDEARIEFAPSWLGVGIKIYSPFMLRKAAALAMPAGSAQRLQAIWSGLKDRDSDTGWREQAE